MKLDVKLKLGGWRGKVRSKIKLKMGVVLKMLKTGRHAGTEDGGVNENRGKNLEKPAAYVHVCNCGRPSSLHPSFLCVKQQFRCLKIRNTVSGSSGALLKNIPPYLRYTPSVTCSLYFFVHIVSTLSFLCAHQSSNSGIKSTLVQIQHRVTPA